MGYQVLARKWRPQKFSEVIGQDHVTRTLANAVQNNKVAHAYLLTGTRGVGKTTIARIFAKAIRCQNLTASGEPCLQCSSCLEVSGSNSIDYIEIDGASNNSVEDIRELIENVQYLPTSGKYKVYVIDEVHMLTVSAFNALLKTLEEPPEHVVFIFATTDPQKLLGTVLSRCQRLDFKNVSEEVIASHLQKILETEEIQVENPSIIQSIAKYARGSVRDSLSIADQVISLCHGKTITESEMNAALGLVGDASLNRLFVALFKKNRSEVVNSYKSILAENIDLQKVSLQILDTLFFMIESVDSQGNLVSDRFKPQDLENVSLVELVWVYETLAKDFEWALSSLNPEQAFGFCLAKNALREKILSQELQPINVKKKLSEVETNPIQEPALPKEVPSWNGFLRFSSERNPALAMNLERGNILNKGFFTASEMTMEIGFDHEAKIFFDFLKEPENNLKLQELINEYLEADDYYCELKLLNQTDKDSVNFESTVAIQEKEKKEMQDNMRQEILDNKHIQTAEKIFNTKVSKVVLNDK